MLGVFEEKNKIKRVKPNTNHELFMQILARSNRITLEHLCLHSLMRLVTPSRAELRRLTGEVKTADIMFSVHVVGKDESLVPMLLRKRD